ncbi:MAG: hypothetical protein NTY94_24050 [Alphaproteobacteria bacterium]|nr:hypothetical protein [Alphaproteobacteria bacterium]
MARFDEYLLEVQKRMGLQPVQLVRPWAKSEIKSIETAINAAVTASALFGSMIPNFTGTNQSKGNKAANHLMSIVPSHLPALHTITDAKGAGYPDRIFNIGNLGFCMELKATSNWNNIDSNRRVLTSTPRKMLKLLTTKKIGAPPAHFLCTVLYSEPNSTVTGLRLDFLDPSSEISVRLEASTSQRLLTQSPHHKVILP